ncbi:unnamed protein product [Allacma fusca]|uniref:Gfo/Idh/MocA-like oxidoreductase N-terminal domain-containing protein n=1 Tax=Allacma fusca TaxID=39272 RepID=A0A8J2JZT1_9HEXA|nr:unnamed protein product [Allacma fusca]
MKYHTHVNNICTNDHNRQVGLISSSYTVMSAQINGLPVPPVPQKPVTIAIVGAGARGQGYATFATAFPEWLKVVAVADPHDYKRNLLVKEHGIPTENTFSNWTEMVKLPRLSDAVAICTQDHLHTAPAIAFANLKYNILLEKPMAVSLQECQDIVEAVKRNGIIFAVGHVLRYTPYTTSIMQVLNSEQIGDIVNIQHLEPVGFWHFAHSFVRGNWGNESRATFSLMAKSCHDIDLIPFMMRAGKCKKISSFGSLKHFRKENKPKEAGNAKKCLDCIFEPSCPYSAKKIYVDPYVNDGHTGWPTSIVHPNEDEMDIESLTESLQNSNYGSCVYEVDNDVCDQQVVSMEFENGSTASFSMIAFTEALCERKTRIFGTRGEIVGDGVDEIIVFDFLTRKRTIIKPSAEEQLGKSRWSSGHGGGDYGLMRGFVQACATGNPNYILSGPEETLDSHIYVFAAEEARKTNTVVDIEQFKKTHLN